MALLPPQPLSLSRCRSVNSPYGRISRFKPACSVGFTASGDSFTEKSGYLFEVSSTEAASLAEYDVSRISAIYRRRPITLIRRLFQIGTTFGKWFAVRYLDSVSDRSDEMFKVRAEELRKILVELGPAYIKIAQAVSSRADLIPPSYLDELSLLQDRIAPFSSEIAFNMMEQELKLQIDELFTEISPEPVAAASLGQVYKARLRGSGKLVAVKVQRPGVQAAIALDILILRFFAGLIKKVRKFNTDLPAVVDEWASSLFREMDYRKEANNGIRFRNLYGGLADVAVPEMYLDYSTSRVLTMEWIEGKRLSEVKDLYLVEVGVYCSFNQLLEYGFYHADPHPGNLLRTSDGKLAYLDFGMMGEFKQELRDGFIEACLHLVNRDFKALAKDFVTLGLLPATADKEAVTKALTGVFEDAVARGIRNISFGDLLGNLGTTMYKFKFQIPSYFSLVIRSLAVLEGIAIGFNPNYKVLGSTYPWIAKKVLSDSSPKLQQSLQELLYEDGSFRIDRLESLLTESLRANTQKALVEKPTEDNDPKMVVQQLLSFTLTKKGAFVREIILEEFAKGLDAFGVATASAAVANVPLFGAPVSFFGMTEEDRTNLITLHRLFLLLSGSQVINSQETKDAVPNRIEQRYIEEASTALSRLSSVQEVLPLLSIISELPPEMQQQLFRLPGDLAGRLVSRATARTIRRIFL